MTQDEALKLALEFIENSECGTADLEACIKKALAQPEQKPVGYVIVKDHGKVNILDFDFDLDVAEQLSEGKYPAYTTPPKRTWVGLTDEEIDVVDEATWEEDHKSWGIHDFARAVEAKLKEKNGA